MQLDYAILCNVAGYLQDNRLVIFGADIEGIEATGFPTMAPQLCVVAKFLVVPDEPLEGHTICVAIVQPDGTRSDVCNDEPLEAIRNPSDRNRPSGAQVMINLLMGPLNGPGTYTIVLSADGREVKRMPFHVGLTGQGEPHATTTTD